MELAVQKQHLAGGLCPDQHDPCHRVRGKVKGIPQLLCLLLPLRSPLPPDLNITLKEVAEHPLVLKAHGVGHTHTRLCTCVLF